MRRWLTLMFAILIPAMVFANDAKLAPELKQAASDHVVSVIVQYKTVPGNIHKDRIRMSGGAVVRDLALVKSVTAQVPSSALAALSEDDAVVYISPDRPVRSHMNNAAPAVLASYAWSLGLDGSGIGVAVIDSGIHNVDDLADSSGQSRIVYSLDLVGGGTDDGYGHGTHVAGIIGGNGKDSTCPTCDVAIRGIAPNVNLINLRALDNTGAGTDSTVIAAIEAAIQLKDTYNIRVINLSVGRPVYESYTQDPVCQAVEQAWQAGIVVVVSAGNDGRDNSMGTNGYGTIEAPGNDPYVITVGAMNTKGTPDRIDDVMTSYSSKGPTIGDSIVKPDLVAPGNRVVSLQEPGTLLQTYPQNRPSTGYYMKGIIPRPSSSYFTLSGTSMATGVVSGAAALMLQQDPTLTPDQVKARLMKTAYKNLPLYTTVVDAGATYNIQSDVFTVGAGYLDLQAALSNLDRAPGVAKSATAYYDASSGNVYFLADSTTPWGQSAMWGTSMVWGDSAFLPNSAMWGGSPTPGSTAGGNAAMWGGSPTPGSTAGGNSAMWGGSPTPGSTAGGNSAMWGGSPTPGSTAQAGGNSAMWGGAPTPGSTGPAGGTSVMWGGSRTPGSSALPGGNSAMWGGSPTPGSSALPGGNSAMWGGSPTPGSTAVAGGNSAMWGGSPTPGSTAVAGGNSAMWGGSPIPGSTVLWGGNSAMWGGNSAMW